jgi:hypothetical protein
MDTPTITFFIPGKPLTKEKFCHDCKSLLNTDNFYINKAQKDGLSSQCKECTKIRNNKRWIENKENILKQKRDYYNNNEYVKSNYKKRNRERYHSVIKKDPKKKLDWNISTEIRKSLKKGIKANRSWNELVGYSTDELMNHIEKQFKTGMTWENHGEWHIDHIKPKCLFKYSSAEDKEFKECWALNNLQPLWAAENLHKSWKYDY